jgi:hypothetical protein
VRASAAGLLLWFSDILAAGHGAGVSRLLNQARLSTIGGLDRRMARK